MKLNNHCIIIIYCLYYGLIIVKHQCLAAADSSLTTRPLGTLEMVLKSRAPTSALKDNWIMDLLSVTVNFLDTALFEYFDQSDQVRFEKLSASVQEYDMRVEDPSVANATPYYIATVTLSGQAFFVNGAAPGQELVNDITKAAFFENNEGFLKGLWDESLDPFLREISSAIVKVNGVPTNITGITTDKSKAEDDDDDNRSFKGLETWVIALIAGGGAFCLVFSACIGCICCTTIDDVEAAHDPPAKTKSATTKGTAEEEEDTTAGHDDVGTEFNVNTNFGTNAQQSPSTVHSITSQDSSIFTYNPKSVKSFTSMDNKTYGSGFFTTTSGFDMDVQAWQNGGTVIKDGTQLPFGHDISAITNKKDLSLIEEEGDTTGMDGSVKTEKGLISPRQYLTEAAVKHLERNDKWSSRQRHSSGQIKSIKPVINTSLLSRRSLSTIKSVGSSSATNSNMENSTSDVITDLKDLSFQIEAHRQRSSNNY